MQLATNKIHKNSIKILEEIGIKLFSDTVLDILKKNNIKTDGNIAYFTEEQIMSAIKNAPSSFGVTARNEKYNMSIGGDRAYYCPGYGCTHIIDKSGLIKQALHNDYIQFLKLTESSEIFSINGGILVQPCDIPQEKSHLILMNDILKYSEKVVLSMPGTKERVQELMDMLLIVFGENDLKNSKRAFTLINTISPLIIDESALDTMLICVKYGQPLIITPGPVCGGTGPITLAGNLALGNAEALAAIAITQMINPGTPVVYGLLPTTLNITNACVSIGTPAFTLQSKYSAELAKFYNLPSRSGGTQSDALGVCAQSGYEAMMNMFSTRLSGSNLVIHSAGILNSFGAMSYEKFINDLEIISMVEYYFKDISLNESDFAFDVIKETGHGGHFITSEHTFENCRTAPWFHKTGLNEKLADNKVFSEEIDKKIIRSMDSMLNAYVMPEMDALIQKQLKNYLEKKL